MFIVDGDKHFAHANNCFPKRVCSITLYKKYLSLWVRCLYVFLPPLCSLVWSGEMVGSLFCLVCLRVALVVILQGLIPLLSFSLYVQCFQFLAFLVLLLLRFCCQLKFALFYPPYCASSVFVTFLSVMPCLVTSSFNLLALCLACTVFSFFVHRVPNCFHSPGWLLSIYCLWHPMFIVKSSVIAVCFLAPCAPLLCGFP